MFRGAKIQARDFTRHNDLRDPTGHGTANASLLVAQGNGWILGKVPTCILLFGKVLIQGDRYASEKAIAQGIRWAFFKGADLIVLPFGTLHGSYIIAREIRNAAQADCRILAAAGNCGPSVIAFPALLKEVIAVSALGADGNVYPGCCQRKEVDIFVPGQDIPAVNADGYVKLNGSSPAAILAAAAIARHEIEMNSERPCLEAEEN